MVSNNDTVMANTTEHSLDPIIWVGTIGSVIGILCVTVVVVVVVVVLVFLVCRLTRRPRAPSIPRVNENPVYGMYYFPDGERIDYATVEVEDENPYYGT